MQKSQADFLARRRWVHLTWTIALLISVGIVISLALLSNWAEDRVRSSLEARNSVERFYHTLIEAERAQRAYILTQDRDYLTRHSYAILKLDDIAEQLRAVVARNDVKIGALEELYSLAEERNRQLATAIDVLHSDGFDAAVQEIRHNEARQTTKLIFDRSDEIDEEEDRLLRAQERQMTLLRGFLLAALLITMAGAILISTISFEGEHRMAERLADLNRDLEAKVQERTHELEAQRQLVEHLLADISHRLGNNLSMISSYLLLQARRTEDEGAREALQDVHRRILSVASAQRRLHVDSATAAVDMQTYLHALVEDLRGTLAGGEVSLELKAEAIEMRGSDAVSLGIIINELVTNALKYAFPDGGGRITVGIGTRGDEVVVNVDDNGRGYDGNARNGLGSLVVQSMVRALGGRAAHTSVTADPQRPGTVWRIQFPLRRPQTVGAKPSGTR